MKQETTHGGAGGRGRKGVRKGARIAGRIAACFFSFVALLLVGVIALLLICYYGPSKTARDRVVLTLTETSAAGFLATWFLPDATVQQIIRDNALVPPEGTTDTDLIRIPGSDTGDDTENPGGDTETFDKDKIELIDISGKTYKGKLLIVNNPKRVTIGTPDAYGYDKQGISTIDMVRRENALYGVNGGGFQDGSGHGNGGVPTGTADSAGIVISEGNLMWGERNRSYEVIGIDRNGILILGQMTAQEALDRGIVEAINFGPYLIMNGEPCAVQGMAESSLNPRTAIGQRADGAMLILTIDGRQPTSAGASYEDLIEIMMRYGAVNAANLDGGSSTYMVQNAANENNPQIITQLASFYGPRRMATSILVSRESP